MLLGGNWKKSDGKFYNSIGVNNLLKTLTFNYMSLLSLPGISIYIIRINKFSMFKNLVGRN